MSDPFPALPDASRVYVDMIAPIIKKSWTGQGRLYSSIIQDSMAWTMDISATYTGGIEEGQLTACQYSGDNCTTSRCPGSDPVSICLMSTLSSWSRPLCQL